MSTIVPASTHAIPSFADGAYMHDIAIALAAATPLIVAWLFVYATFKIIRLVTRATTVALGITTALVAAFVMIGHLHR
ncbi:hypothetical protein [Actinoplanes derwentensis]|uniref:Uncharacterized protein n=1 Tax=Actinoplanes derwentensis TaxID=113562 RepID=A0A1H1WW37_9ACTN|nr:hypothetical protein [Actinoplanes derwentensis]GID86952.1 hypothetical protein Ade03nite_58760 [Actinoplanes derwentensis]SDT01367.1 hypothetical protein SAMN04489716_2255 [Actinoplanes derwentensis]